MSIKIVEKIRSKGTICIYIANFNKKIINKYMIHLSLKKPWFIPKVEKNYLGCGLDLYSKRKH